MVLMCKFLKDTSRVLVSFTSWGAGNRTPHSLMSPINQCSHMNISLHQPTWYFDHVCRISPLMLPPIVCLSRRS